MFWLLAKGNINWFTYGREAQLVATCSLLIITERTKYLIRRMLKLKTGKNPKFQVREALKRKHK